MITTANNTYYRLPILDGLELLHAKKHTKNFPFHTHNTFNITLVLDQVFSTKLTNQLIQAPKGTIFITNPGEVHSTVCESKIGNSFFTFYIAPEVLQEFDNGKTVFFTDKVIYDIALFEEFHFLSQNFNNQSVFFERRLKIALKKLVLNYTNESTFLVKETNLLQQFLEENTFEKFSLESSARKFGLDKYKFLRLFKSETGLTPNNYIILKRIEKSKTLLHSNSDLLDIALETGFYDATHFCKHFKKITGISPITYKKA